MTIDEYRRALEALSEEKYARFQHHFGGERLSREDRVTGFVHNPKHERHICALLGLETEGEKMTRAALDSAHAARTSANMALCAVAVSIAALVIALVT